MDEITLDAVDQEARSRIAAATGDAAYRRIERRAATDVDAEHEYVVEALTGDRITVMRVWVRDDGSMGEVTNSFTSDKVVEAATSGASTELVVDTAEGRRRIAVAPDTAAAVAAILPRNRRG